jgi:hypothetical protein
VAGKADEVGKMVKREKRLERERERDVRLES